MFPMSMIVDHEFKRHNKFFGLATRPVHAHWQLHHELGHALALVQLEHRAQRPHHRKYKESLKVTFRVRFCHHNINKKSSITDLIKPDFFFSFFFC